MILLWVVLALVILIVSVVLTALYKDHIELRKNVEASNKVYMGYFQAFDEATRDIKLQLAKVVDVINFMRDYEAPGSNAEEDEGSKENEN